VEISKAENRNTILTKPKAGFENTNKTDKPLAR
jgi:hypothetical protein